MTPEPIPIACSLAADSFRDRVAWIAQVNFDALQGHHLDGLRLTLDYDLAARPQIERLIGAEQACCPFLGFELREEADRLVVVIEAPEAVRDTVDLIFQPFLPQTSPTAGGCGCCERAPA